MKMLALLVAAAATAAIFFFGGSILSAAAGQGVPDTSADYKQSLVNSHHNHHQAAIDDETWQDDSARRDLVSYRQPFRNTQQMQLPANGETNIFSNHFFFPDWTDPPNVERRPLFPAPAPSQPTTMAPTIPAATSRFPTPPPTQMPMTTPPSLAPVPPPTNEPTTPATPPPTQMPITAPPSPAPVPPPTNEPTTPAPTPFPSTGPETGLQPACFTNDGGNYNICLDLNSRSGQYEPWMDVALAAANDIEQLVTGNLSPITMNTSALTPDFPSLDISCPKYPEVIDDIYICAKDRIYPPEQEESVIAAAGPYGFRPTDTDLTGLSYISGMSVNVAFANDSRLQAIIRHELFHALGFPYISWKNGLLEGRLYKSGTNADAEWKKLGCSGQILLQPIDPAKNRSGHWDEECLEHELMTPEASGNLALSRMSIAALEDLGYDVNYEAAEDYTIDDLGSGCGASCPQAPSAGNSFIRGSAKRLRPKENKAEQAAIMISIRSDLIYFHEQLEKAGYVKGANGLYHEGGREDGFTALAQIDVLYLGSDGDYHDLSVTYDDIKDMP